MADKMIESWGHLMTEEEHAEAWRKIKEGRKPTVHPELPNAETVLARMVRDLPGFLIEVEKRASERSKRDASR